MKHIRFSTVVGNWKAGDEQTFSDDSIVDTLVAEKKGVEIFTTPVVKAKILTTLSELVEQQGKADNEADRAARQAAAAAANPNVPNVKNKSKALAGSN